MPTPRQFAAACLALSVSAPAFSQDSVTIYGGIDLALARYWASGGGSRTQLVSGGNQNSRLGIRGREDLGGGLYAAFEIEAGLLPDSGGVLPSNANNQVSGAGTNLTFNFARRSFVALGGTWGELRLGRDYVPSFWPLYLYDPFRTGVGFGGITILGSSATTNLRASNSIGYFSPGCANIVCQGFFGQAMYAFGENPSGGPNPHDGNVAGLRIGYNGGNWELSVAETTSTNAGVGDFTQTSGGGYFETKVARFMVLAGENRTGLPVAALNGGTKAPFWQVGALFFFGASSVPVAYTRVRRNDAESSSASKIAVGYVYSLSKRTALYTTYARIDNHNGLGLPVNVGGDAGPLPLPGGGARGWDVGIRHVF